MFVPQDKLQCTIYEMSLMLHINLTFCRAQDVWWFLSEEIPRIMHETDAKNQVIVYGYTNYSQSIDSQSTELSLFKFIKLNYLDIQDAACLLMVHILQHSTSLQISVDTKYDGHRTQESRIPTPRRKIWQFDLALHPTMLSSEWRVNVVRSRMDLSPSGIA